MKDTYRYYILAYEDARRMRPIKHEHGGTTVLTDGAEALGRAELLASDGSPVEWCCDRWNDGPEPRSR